MANYTEVLMVFTGLALALAAFAIYRRRQYSRVERIKAWINEFLSARYGEPPFHLHIDCSDDPLWPVLVAFERPRSGTRHNLRFYCARSKPPYPLVSETEAPRR